MKNCKELLLPASSKRFELISRAASVAPARKIFGVDFTVELIDYSPTTFTFELLLLELPEFTLRLLEAGLPSC